MFTPFNSDVSWLKGLKEKKTRELGIADKISGTNTNKNYKTVFIFLCTWSYSTLIFRAVIMTYLDFALQEKTKTQENK